MRRANLGREPVLRQRADDPACAIIGISRVGEVLELAPAALGEVTARRQLVPRALDECAVGFDDVARDGEGAMLPAGADPVAARRDADNRIAHRSASVKGSAATRSSAIMLGPARSAARRGANRCAGRLELGMPGARSAA